MTNPKLSRQNVEELARLYRERGDVEKARGYADDRNFWLGIVNDAFGGTGTRSSVRNAAQGDGELAEVLRKATVAHLDAIISDFTSDIEATGGSP